MGITEDTKVGTASPTSEEAAEVGSIRELKSLHVDGVDPVFEHQARLVNHAVQVIGMGKVKSKTPTVGRETLTAGSISGLFSFSVDMAGFVTRQLWQTTVSDALAQVAVEFQPKHSAFLSLALIAGLVVGASFWGLGCDLIGRRLAFNLTLLIAGVFGTAAGAADSFVSCAVLISFCGFGVGGNLPVDSAVFLEFLPGTHQYLLEILAVWWSVGQAIPAGAAWGFLSHFSCSEDTPAGQCLKKDNMGWRYLMYTMGALTLTAFFLRFVCFNLRESPRYLIGQGRYEEAIDVLNDVAKYNGTTQPLTVEDLLQVERDFASAGRSASVTRPTAWQRTIAQFRPGGFKHIRALFSTRKVAYSTSLIILVWGMIGLASPLYANFLPEYLALHGAQAGSGSIAITYRNNFIIIACSIPGTLMAGWFIGLPKIGRRGTLGIALILTAVFQFAFTTARTQASILAFNCVTSFVSYIMWGALYCYTPEVIPSIHRGTGCGLAAAFNRICGLQAPIIATYVGYNNKPIFVSASLYIVAGFISFIFPYETSGKASL